MNNRMGNVHNRYQTQARKVLCLCSAGLLRSPTAANVLHQKFGYNTRAAGVTQDFALVPVDLVLLEWADEIVCVETSVTKKLEDFVLGEVTKGHIGETDAEDYMAKVTTLDVPDRFEWNDPTLRATILKQYQENGDKQ